jgi:hypothetical protein
MIPLGGEWNGFKRCGEGDKPVEDIGVRPGLDWIGEAAVGPGPWD